ncbi:hypothetical protein DAEQUDRAFT_743004 [Daedalea quercina L-15889]|uniref:SAM domain-containing protein n=1 Tax=Daedalea quercina L-15889 TaxID=1314783 RepID=A0A165THQ1_9APHY|nr:hypothetical protein DAEQUDRAFT_743004 [Daedalea quercina L-15889]
MTTERALPVPPVQSPSPSKFSFPSPGKPDPNLKPNPHPYAVKTTTSALLTRSNSSGHNEATRHYYVPLSPNASRSPEGAKSHKLSKSLTSVAESPSRSPRPLPAPPTSNSANTSPVHSADPSLSVHEADSSFPRRTKRADTLPTFPSNEHTLELLAIPEDLPTNPKVWTSSQLSMYLTTALRITSQVKTGQPGAVPLPVRVAKDIAAFTRSRMITGRMFLRLTEADLESMGMNKKWRELLLATSQELRQNVLKGRIWGEGVSPSPSPGSTSPLPNMFSNAFYNSNSSASSLELSADEGAQPAQQSSMPTNFTRFLSALRVFAISGRSWRTASFVFTLGMVPVGTNLVGDIRESYALISVPFYGVACDFTSLLSTGTSLKIRKEASAVNLRAPIVTLLLRDGASYGSLLLILNVLHLALEYTDVFWDITYFVTGFALHALDRIALTQFLFPSYRSSSIIVSRFLLNLRQVHQEDEMLGSQPSFVASRASRLIFASTVVGNLGEHLDHGHSISTSDVLPTTEEPSSPSDEEIHTPV